MRHGTTTARIRPLPLLALAAAIWLAGGTTVKASQAPRGASVQECLDCHGRQGFSASFAGQRLSLYVDPQAYTASIHGTNACTTCHPLGGLQPHVKSYSPRATARAVDDNCRHCHKEVAGQYQQGVHAREFYGASAALCSDCHGSHDIRKKTDSRSLVYPTNVPSTCGRCHQGEEMKTYQESFHGRAISLGTAKTAQCASCHGSHDIRGPEDPASAVAEVNLPQTCARCHLYPRENFTKGKEHAVVVSKGPGAPMYYTLKFFTWLTIVTMVALILHIEVELLGKLKRLGG